MWENADVKVPFAIRVLQQRVVFPFLRRLSPRFNLLAAHLIARLLPESKWYTAAFQITRFVTAISVPMTGGAPYRANWMLHYWLKHLFCYNRPFPIPIRAVGAEAIFEARANSKGMVVAAVHVPLTILAVRTLVDLKCPPDAVLAGAGGIIDGKFWAGGMAERLPGLDVANRIVLVKVRNILRRGGVVVGMIDTQLGGSLNGNLLRLLRPLGARLVFMYAELQKNGEILVRFYTPPDPFCCSEEGVLSNLEFIRAKVDEILNPGSRQRSEALHQFTS